MFKNTIILLVSLFGTGGLYAAAEAGQTAIPEAVGSAGTGLSSLTAAADEEASEKAEAASAAGAGAGPTEALEAATAAISCDGARTTFKKTAKVWKKIRNRIATARPGEKLILVADQDGTLIPDPKCGLGCYALPGVIETLVEGAKKKVPLVVISCTGEPRRAQQSAALSEGGIPHHPHQLYLFPPDITITVTGSKAHTDNIQGLWKRILRHYIAKQLGRTPLMVGDNQFIDLIPDETTQTTGALPPTELFEVPGIPGHRDIYNNSYPKRFDGDPDLNDMAFDKVQAKDYLAQLHSKNSSDRLFEQLQKLHDEMTEPDLPTNIQELSRQALIEAVKEYNNNRGWTGTPMAAYLSLNGVRLSREGTTTPVSVPARASLATASAPTVPAARPATLSSTPNAPLPVAASTTTVAASLRTPAALSAVISKGIAPAQQRPAPRPAATRQPGFFERNKYVLTAITAVAAVVGVVLMWRNKHAQKLQAVRA
jgi:hypothetical protein